MNKNLKEWGLTIFLIIGFVLVPLAINLYYEKIDREDYYSDVDENYETCVERAKRDSRDKEWCREIRKSSDLAYQSASSGSKNAILFIVIFTGLVILLISVRKLRIKIETKDESDV